MAFGMSPFPLQFGTRGGGGAASDPTVLTPAILAALGFAYTRTGEVYGRRAPGGPGNYVRHATNDPEFDFTEVDGKNYPSLIVRGAATPLISYSADLTNAAWTKTGAMTALALGGLEHGPEWRGQVVVSETFDYVDKAAAIAAGWSSNGTEASENCEWDTVDGAIVVTRGSGSNVGHPRRTFSGFSSGKFYLFEWQYAGDPVANIGALVNPSKPDRIIVFVPSGSTLYTAFWPISLNQSLVLLGFTITEVDAHSVLTATGANALCARTITRASAPRRSRVRIAAPATNAGSVLVSHGAPTGSALYQDPFDSDTSGEWLPGVGSVDGVISHSSGTLLYTRGANDNEFARIVRPITGFTIGKLYRVTGTITGTASVKYFGMSANSNGDFAGGKSVAGTGTLTFVIQATATTMYYIQQIRDTGGGQTQTLDDASVYEVAETEIPAGTFADLELDEYTGANPQYAIRLTDDEDVAEVYDIQGFELATGTPPPWCVPQGATPVIVGASILAKTLNVAPTALDISLLVHLAPTSINVPRVMMVGTTADRLLDLYHNGTTSFVQYAAASNVASVLITRPAALDDLHLIRAKIAAGTGGAELTVDGSSISGTPSQAIPQVTAVRLGAFGTGLNHLCGEIVALRDNNGQLLGSPGKGFNLEAIQRYEAAL